MKNIKQLIIVGGGASIAEGIKKDLWERLKNKVVCGINYSYRYFDSSYLVCLNYIDFYAINRKELTKLPLIITPSRPHPSKWEKNTILINKNFQLSGILALHIGIALKPKEIFLLGYDYRAINNRTHFYQGKIAHRGIGRTHYYDAYPGHAERDFGIFKQEKNVRIYNVSLNSNIETFPKLSYKEFFKKLDNNIYNQKELRQYIKDKLNGLTK